MKNSIIKYHCFILPGLLLFLIMSCGKSDEKPLTEEGSTTISIERAKSLKISPGKNRVNLNWLVSDPQISRYIVFYNNRTDSIEKKISRKYETDTVSLIIDGLSEQIHTFRIFNCDIHGNRSPQADISGKIYGSSYQSSLSNISISKHYLENKDLIIAWDKNKSAGLINIKLKYVTLDGNNVSQEITDVKETCVLPNFPSYGKLQYMSTYLPEPKAIDTFHTEYQEFIPYEKVTVNPETFANLIKDKTDLVNSIEKNITNTISKGLTFTEIEYLNKQNAPMALYILVADLEHNITLKATAAVNGENLNSKETVRKQIAYVRDRNYEVLAAVNGDYWRVNANETENTPLGQTYGALYIDGVMKKDLTRSATQYYFSAILKNGLFTLGDKEHYAEKKNNILETIGGRYLLVNNGVNVSNQISNKDLAPRTSIGKFDPHQIVFIVIDGRRPSHSQGVTMQELGLIYEAIGVRTAINLDGGGSTTLFVKDNDSHQLVLKNWPSSNSERSVANAWTIVSVKQ